MGRLKDLTGMKFGRLTVIERAPNKGKQTYWKCLCDCGNFCIVNAYSIVNGGTKSCGCYRKEFARTHGMYQTKIYHVWYAMKQRCLNPNSKKYPSYGGRGIKLCEDWLDFQKFFDYVSTLEHYGEKNYSLDRIDNNGNYEPGNVRWADIKTQQRNTRSNHLVEYKGQKMITVEAAELSGINVNTLRVRLHQGLTGDELFKPVKK